MRVGVINNIWLFIPLGTGLYRWFQKKWVLLIPFVMSVAIETTQFITGLGIAEFDDVFGNTMGGWIGVLVAWMWLSWRKFRMEEQKTEGKKWWKKRFSIPKRKSLVHDSRNCKHGLLGNQ